MKKKFEVNVSLVKTMKIEMELHIDTGITLDELVEDLKYQAEVVTRAKLAGDESAGEIMLRKTELIVNEIRLLDEVKIVK